MKRSFITISILFLFLTSCTSASTGEIRGIVVDTNNGLPIASVNVMTDPPTSSVTTNADGKYSIARVPPGNYRVIAIRPDNTSKEVNIAVTAGKTTTADLHFTVEHPLSDKLANGNFDENDFGVIANWGDAEIDLHRWYLVQDVQPSQGTENTRWVEWVRLLEDDRGYGLKSTDYQSCDSFCSTSAVQIVPAEAHKTYTLWADVMQEEGKGGKIYIDFLNADRVRIKEETKGGFSEEWGRQEVTAVAPEGTKYIRVILYTNNGDQGIVYWDNVELRVSE